MGLATEQTFSGNIVCGRLRKRREGCSVIEFRKRAEDLSYHFSFVGVFGFGVE